MNVALSSRHTVHATNNDGTSHPKCHNFGAPHGSEAYRTTTREVSCKKCLKALAADAQKEADFQDRLAASLEPATEASDLGHVHADREAAADAQPEDVKAVRQDAEAKAAGARYAAQLLAGKAEAAPVAYRPWGTDVLPEGVTMDTDTRALSGPIKALLDLHRRGLATLDDDGDLILN